MANKTLFSSTKSKLPGTDTWNEAGGRAYKFAPKHALAQVAATGCFNGVCYASVDVAYHASSARATCVTFEQWGDANASEEIVLTPWRSCAVRVFGRCLSRAPG